MFLSQFKIDTLASEVNCLRVIERRDLSNERNTFKSKTIFYHKKTRLKPERATRPIPKGEGSVRDRYKADSEKKKALVRDSYKADPEKKKASVRECYKAYPEKKAPVRDSYKGPSRKEEGLFTRDSYNADIESKKSAKRQRYQEDLEENRAAKRQQYQEDVEETAPLKGRNTRTIQLPLGHLKGIGIGMTPLSDWLNVLPRGSGIAGVHYHPKVCHGMLYCTSIKKL